VLVPSCRQVRLSLEEKKMSVLVLTHTLPLFLYPQRKKVATEEKRIWSQIGMLLAVAYFVFVNIVYFTILTVTMPHTLNGDSASVEILRYVPKSFMTGIDALGYTSMSLATLFAAPVFFGTKLKNWIRVFFISNGIIAPIILSTQIYPLMAYAGATWILTMPLSSFLFMVLCYREMKSL
jgi:hypothetical protein